MSAFAQGHKTKLLERDRLFLKLFQKLLTANEPRELKCPEQSNVVMITDACFEADSRDRICGLGGVLKHLVEEKSFSLFPWMKPNA